MDSTGKKLKFTTNMRNGLSALAIRSGVAAAMFVAVPAAMAASPTPVDTERTPTSAGLEKLVGTYDSVGTGGGATLFPNTYNFVTQNLVSCKNVNGCSIGGEAMVMIDPKGQSWAICLDVDGNTLSCQYQAQQSGLTTGNARAWTTAPMGKHSLRTYVTVSAPDATLSDFQTDARVYTP
jgi:hypothetical protein